MQIISWFLSSSAPPLRAHTYTLSSQHLSVWVSGSVCIARQFVELSQAVNKQQEILCQKKKETKRVKKNLQKGT